MSGLVKNQIAKQLARYCFDVTVQYVAFATTYGLSRQLL